MGAKKRLRLFIPRGMRKTESLRVGRCSEGKDWECTFVVCGLGDSEMNLQDYE